MQTIKKEELDYFAGARIKCIAHYPQLADQIIEWFDNEFSAKVFVEDHTNGGANVDMLFVEWSPVIRRSNWFPAVRK